MTTSTSAVIQSGRMPIPTTMTGANTLSTAAPNSGTAMVAEGNARNHGALARPQAMSASGSSVYGTSRRITVFTRRLRQIQRRWRGDFVGRSYVHPQVPGGARVVGVL